ncbi:hypothetical protein BD309DRAFT_152151 [Dichomitus squalens]|nr:hypothetical protein BD309DRAFT_152151 [Dichomitus squalens]
MNPMMTYHQCCSLSAEIVGFGQLLVAALFGFIFGQSLHDDQAGCAGMYPPKCALYTRSVLLATARQTKYARRRCYRMLGSLSLGRVDYTKLAVLEVPVDV